jgi:hypothetical protein
LFYDHLGKIFAFCGENPMAALGAWKSNECRGLRTESDKEIHVFKDSLSPHYSSLSPFKQPAETSFQSHKSSAS